MSARAKNRRPTHPGAVLREDVLPSLDITQTELADRLGVSRRTIPQIFHERRPLTADMAILSSGAPSAVTTSQTLCSSLRSSR